MPANLRPARDPGGGRADQEVPGDGDSDPDGLGGAGGGSAAQVALTRPDPDGSAPVSERTAEGLSVVTAKVLGCRIPRL